MRLNLNVYVPAAGGVIPTSDVPAPQAKSDGVPTVMVVPAELAPQSRVVQSDVAILKLVASAATALLTE